MRPRLAQADIWLQAASAGEAFLALSILAELAPPAPVKVLITTTTDQGMEVLRRGLGEACLHPNIAAAVDLFPFDLPAAVNRAVSQVAPQVVVLLETELWPAILHALKQREIPVLVLNARMSERSGSRYKKTRWLWQCLAPDRVLAISETDRRRYAQVFPDTPTAVMTNIKFDILESGSRETEEMDPKLSGIFQVPSPCPSSPPSAARKKKDHGPDQRVELPGPGPDYCPISQAYAPDTGTEKTAP